MTEIDAKKVIRETPKTRRDVLAKFVATFSGGLSLKTVLDSGPAAQAQVSAQIDSRKIAYGLRSGGNSTRLLEGSFEEFIPIGGQAENIVQELPGKVIHISEMNLGSDTDLLKAAPKSALVIVDPATIAEKPARTFVINVFSTSEEPEPDIKHWFKSEEEHKAA